jgi:hypothetical protein
MYKDGKYLDHDAATYVIMFCMFCFELSSFLLFCFELFCSDLFCFLLFLLGDGYCDYFVLCHAVLNNRFLFYSYRNRDFLTVIPFSSMPLLAT